MQLLLCVSWLQLCRVVPGWSCFSFLIFVFCCSDEFISCILREVVFRNQVLNILFTILQVFNYWSYYYDPTPDEASSWSTCSCWCCCKFWLAYFYAWKACVKKLLHLNYMTLTSY